jgi:hypothetical protein
MGTQSNLFLALAMSSGESTRFAGAAEVAGHLHGAEEDHADPWMLLPAPSPLISPGTRWMSVDLHFGHALNSS